MFFDTLARDVVVAVFRRSVLPERQVRALFKDASPDFNHLGGHKHGVLHGLRRELISIPGVITTITRYWKNTGQYPDTEQTYAEGPLIRSP